MKKSLEGIIKEIESSDYWDARVAGLECSYFGDEVTLTFNNDDKDVLYRFLGCYRTLFDHEKDYDKLRCVREMSLAQIPYFLQNIEISTSAYKGVEFYSCKLELFPLTLEILCKEIIVERK